MSEDEIKIKIESLEEDIKNDIREIIFLIKTFVVVILFHYALKIIKDIPEIIEIFFN